MMSGRQVKAFPGNDEFHTAFLPHEDCHSPSHLMTSHF